MVKLARINNIVAGFMFLMVIVSIRATYDNIQKYGWVYTQTTIIDDEVTETTVSAATEIFALLYLTILTGVFLINGRVVGMSDFKPLADDEVTGITFPKGKPEHWDLEVDPRTGVIDVTLNDFTMSFPLTKIQGWVEKYEKKQMEEMK